MNSSPPNGDFIRILTETTEGQNVLKAFFDSWNQSHETDIIKKFLTALNEAYLESEKPRNQGVSIKLIISLINGFFEFIRKNHTLVIWFINYFINSFKNSKKNNKY
jgi:hypothetical protein